MSFDLFSEYAPLEDKGSYAPLPEGTYQLSIEQVELKTDINGTRKWWNIKFGLDTESDHPFSRRKIFSACTWENKEKPEWVKKGRSLFADLIYATAIDIKQFKSEEAFVDGISQELEGKSLVARIYHSKDREDNTKVREQVGSYYTLQGVNRGGQKCSAKEAWVTSQNPQNKAINIAHSGPDDDVPF